MKTDVLIIGGGPAASTVGSLLRRYNPDLDVTIIERELFPRDHVGESQLPVITSILEEMGAWDKVEAANFPIKIGSTYRWGINNDLWNINFLMEDLDNTPRPSKLEGQRTRVAFHVDRSIYDKILLEHAESMGCHTFLQTKALSINSENGVVKDVEVSRTLPDGTQEEFTIEARYYVDATGASALLRRALNIDVYAPTKLRNVAFYDYWQDAEWAETIGSGGTRVQIMSIGWGWLWFIPITHTRTSIGLVTHSEFYKNSGKKPEELYLEAIAQEPRISKLVAKATREEKLKSTKDWSYVADSVVGENWFLVGDACGFADPILSAGLTLAHVSGKKAAYSILELERGELEPEWVRSEYNTRHRMNITQHHRFAEFWYSGNKCFTHLKDYCSEIATDAGIALGPEAAFQWMAQGGFTAGNLPDIRSTGWGVAGMTAITGRVRGAKDTWQVGQNNIFKLDLEGATKETVALYDKGKITPISSYKRGDKLLPLSVMNEMVVSALMRETEAVCLHERFIAYFKGVTRMQNIPPNMMLFALEALEALVIDGWVKAEYDPSEPLISFETPTMVFPAAELV
jgi:flavin-dependent dehydrogenase